MTTATQQTDLQKLTATVATLAAALAQSERRHAHLARSLRWGALILVTLVGGATALFVDRFSAAYAQPVFPQAIDAVQALNNINKSLAVFGMLSDSLSRAVPAIEKAMMDNPDVQQSVQDYLKKQGLPVTQENLMTYAAPAIIQNAATTMVHTVVLMQRVREDSNGFRELVGGPGPALRGMQQQLQVMNVALAGMPSMAINMDIMSRNIASMTQSMGSTMGRMGSWIP